MYNGYASSAPATTAVTASARSTVGAAALASARFVPASDQVTTNTAVARAVKNSISAAIVKHTASSTPSTAPLRSQRRGSRNFSTHHTTTGPIQPAVKF